MAGASQTDIVTVVGDNPQGIEVTDTDDAVVTLTPLPVIQVVKDVTPSSLPEPGGTFTFTVVVTNTSTEVLTITSLTDNIYGNIATQGTCTTAIGTVLQPTQTYSCTFPGTFTGVAGDSQTDIVTVVGENPQGIEVTDTDDAVVTLTPNPPSIQVVKDVTPSSRPEPGGTFTFTVVVTNTSNQVLTITSLTDDVYGNIATQGTCTTAIGTVLQPTQTYSCTFPGTFTGTAGDSQTDIVTVVGENPQGIEVTDTDDAVVTLTPNPPSIQVVKDVTPSSRPEPGGTFTFTVVVTNTSNQVLTITSLTDDVYGNIATQGTCTTAIGTVLQPTQTYSCTFPGTFTGIAGDSQTDIVTVVGENPQGTEVTDTDDAVVTLTPNPPTIDVVKDASPLSRPEPGGTFTFAVRSPTPPPRSSPSPR